MGISDELSLLRNKLQYFFPIDGLLFYRRFNVDIALARVPR